MSKEQFAPKDSSLSKGSSAHKEIAHEKTSRELTQEQLADIYFSASGKGRPSDMPVVIKVVERPRLASLIPWIITSLAFLVTAFSLFSTKRIFVDIKVIDDKNLYIREVSSETQTMPQLYSNMPVVNAKVNMVTLDEFTFEGAAYLKSAKEAGGLTLVNSSVAPFARAVRHFDPPLNLSRAKIIFYARGAKGGENVAFALKDRENVQAFHKGKIYPFRGGLKMDWQKAEITPADMTREFDPTAVTSMRFEFGSKDTENKPGDTVYIKDVQWVSP